jgi:hypothetical protein
MLCGGCQQFWGQLYRLYRVIRRNMKTNSLMTICGIMAGLGGIPLAVMGAVQAFPALRGDIPGWWAAFQFPLILIGVVGTMALGVVGKGQDTHSTVAQVRASTAEVVAKASVAAAATTDPAKPCDPKLPIGPES